MYFHANDDLRTIYNFYRDYLQREGFTASKTRVDTEEYKSTMHRGTSASPQDRVDVSATPESDAGCAKVGLTPGCVKIEIEIGE